MHIYHVYNMQIAMVTWMKVRATLGEYSLNALGNTGASMVDTMRCNPERGSQSLKVYLSLDRGLKPALVTLESVVIGC